MHLCVQVETRACLKRLFASNGFLAEFEVHRMVESQWTVEGSGKETSNLSEPLLVFFSTRQLRLSDSQVGNKGVLGMSFCLFGIFFEFSELKCQYLSYDGDALEQVEFARMQIMMAEEAGDEDGFEDAW